MVVKRLLCRARVRKPPPQFSWIDQRLVRERYIERCDANALALYLFLLTVADRHGLSYYSDAAIVRYLSVDVMILHQARRDLVRAGLIAYETPLLSGLGTGSSASQSRSTWWPATRPARVAGPSIGAGAVIDYETFCKIKRYREEEHLTLAQTARALGLHPLTVAKWARREQYRARRSTSRASQLDPFKLDIVRWLEAHPLSAAQIFQRLKEAGYPGGYTIVKDYVRRARPRRAPAFLTLAFAPGEAAQVDWGEYGSIAVGTTRRRLSFFVMVLCYSRLMYLEFTVSQTMEHFLACHQHAFEAFLGVPSKIMVDNLKSAVLEHLIGQAPVFNSRYLDFALHYGFTIAACGVRKGNEKGRVERGVGYVKNRNHRDVMLLGGTGRRIS